MGVQKDLPLDEGSGTIAKILGGTPGADGDSDQLLPGELPESDFPDDVEHWIMVYSELLQTASSLVKAEFAERYQRRLSFWVRRREELASRRSRDRSRLREI